MKADLYKLDGSKQSEAVELPDQIFGIEPNEHAVYLDVKAILTHARQGTASTKNRARVRGGGKKPWRQKGRGVARAGTIRSPLWRGGGTIFGPQPHPYNMKVNKKVKGLARKSVYAAKAKAKELGVVEDLRLDEAKTKLVYNLLKMWEVQDRKVTFLMGELKHDIILASRNIPNVSVILAQNASTYDLLNNDILLLEQSAIPKIEEVLKS